VHHALGAGDAAWAARLIERHVDALLFRSERATVQRWLAALPAGLTGSRPRLLLAQARLKLHSGRVEGIEDLLDSAERALASTAGVVDEPFEPSAGRGASLLANIPATIALDRSYLAELRGDAETAIAFASQALAEAGDGEWMLASHARGYLGLAEWLRGRLGEAEHALSATIAQWRAAGEPALAVRGCHHLGQVQRARGRLDAALGTYQQALEITAVPGQPALPTAGTAYVGMAEVAYQRGELDAALRYVTEGIARCRQLPYTQPLATGLATLAWIRQATGDSTAALDTIGEADRVAPAVTSLLNPVPSQRARLLLAQGDVAAAAHWTQQRALSTQDEPGYPREPEYLVLARVLLAQGRPAPALGLLERLRAAATAQGRAGSIIEIQALRALALAAGGDENAAVDALAEALMLGCPQGYVRVFADEGASMGALLGRLVAAQRAEQAAGHGVPLSCLARLLRAFDATNATPHPGRGSAAAVPGMIEPLTARELEVLQLLAAGTTNQRIAGQLVVTLDTIKKHITHILAKLGAGNRTEAVARARQLGLIP
jgi:LuxR family maltose regulon positive regulatory protein